MPMIAVFAGRRSRSHCKFCGRPIEWATKLASGGKSKTTNVPLNPNAMVVGYDRTAGGVKYELLDSAALHFVTCTKMPDKPKRPRMFGGRA
jgi:hypothetical protein